MGVRWVLVGTVGGVGVKSVGEKGESQREIGSGQENPGEIGVDRRILEIGVDRRILERDRCGQENPGER